MTITWAAFSVVDQGCELPNVEWVFYDNNAPIDGYHDFVKHVRHVVQLEEIDEVTFMTPYYNHNKKLYNYLRTSFPRVSPNMEDQYISEFLTHKVSAKPWDGKL